MDHQENLNESVIMEGEETRDSPIPDKIQQVLEKFQQRLNEKDVQLMELQKKMEVLQTSGQSIASSGKPYLQRTLSKSYQNGSSSQGASSSNRTVSKLSHAQTSGGSGSKCKSRSVPSSPSKRMNISQKSGPSRPQSRQAYLNSEQLPPSGLRAGTSKSFPERGKMKHRAFVGGIFKSSDKGAAETKPSKNNRTGKSGASSKGLSENKREPSQLTKNGNALSSGKSGDSGSCYSTDSRGSSSADFVSVNGSPSPGLSIDDGTSNENNFPIALGEEALSYCELAARLKRMTEEHERLQAEHSRVLASLVEKRSDEKMTRIGEMSEFTDASISESSALMSDRNHLEMIESSSENTLASTDSEQIFSEPKTSNDSVREVCKKEVLRLREESLAVRKRIIGMERKLEESSNHVKELLEDKLNLEATIAEKDGRIKELEGRNIGLQTENELKNCRLANFEQQIQTLQQQHKEIQKQLERDFRAQLAEKALEIKDIEREATETKDFLQTETLTLKEEMAELQLKLKERESQFEQLQNKLQEKSQVSSDLQNNIIERAHTSDLSDDEKLACMLSKISVTLKDNLYCCLCSLRKLAENVKKVVSLVTDEIAPTKGMISGEENDHCSSAKLDATISPTDDQLSAIPSQLQSVSEQSIVIQNVIDALASVGDNGTESEESSTLTLNTSKQLSSPMTPPGQNSNLSLNQINPISDIMVASIEAVSDSVFDNDNQENKSDTKFGVNNVDLSLGQFATNICHENSSVIDHMHKIIKDADNSVHQLWMCLKSIHEENQCQWKITKEESERVEKDLRQQCANAEEHCKNLQEELKHMRVIEERLRDELKETTEKQMETDLALHKSQRQFKEFSKNYDKEMDADHDIKLLREQLQQALTSKKFLEGEKMILTEQLEEMAAKFHDATENNHIGNNGASLAESLKEKISLKNEVKKLRFQILEREHEIANLKTKNVKHQEIVLSHWKTAKTEVKQFDDLFNQVLETLRDIPDVVSSCEQLRRLWMELEDEESRVKT